MAVGVGRRGPAAGGSAWCCDCRRPTAVRHRGFRVGDSPHQRLRPRTAGATGVRLAHTITDGNGFTRTVQENPTTSYRTNGATGSPSDITVGRFIRVQGNVEANGTTLNASKIAVGMGKRPARTPAGRGSAPSGTAGSPSAPSTNG